MPVTTEHPKRAPKPQRRGSSRNASSNNIANPNNPKLVLTQKDIANYVNHLPPHLKELDKLRGKRSGSTQVNTIHKVFLVLATPLTIPGRFRSRLLIRAQIHLQRPTHGL